MNYTNSIKFEKGSARAEETDQIVSFFKSNLFCSVVQHGVKRRLGLLREAQWGVAQANIPVTDEFGCRVVYTN